MSVDLAGLALGIGTSRSYQLARSGALTEGVPVIKMVPATASTAALRRVLGLDAN